MKRWLLAVAITIPLLGTVKLVVRPLRPLRLAAERALIRFETRAGRQSQIDRGQARVAFRHTSAVRHLDSTPSGITARIA